MSESSFPRYDEKRIEENYDLLEKKILAASLDAMNAGQKSLLIIDFIIMGAAQRSIVNMSAFVALVKIDHITPAMALCRLQMDTLLRLHAFTLVDDPHLLAKWIFDGKSVRDFRGANKQKLQDYLLVDSLADELPSAKTVYNLLSSYIHFSDKHFHGIFTGANDETREVSMKIGRPEKVPQKNIDELCHAFFDLTSRIEAKLVAYVDFKNVEVSKMKKEG